MNNKENPNEKLTFEEAMKELESIAEKLEDGSLDLDKSISYFERGTELKKFCQEKLDEAEKKIEILQKGKENDKKVRKKKIKVKNDTGEIDEEDIQGSLL